MFAVVYNNKVILAPVSWNSSFIEASLQRKKLKVSVPRREPKVFPFVLSEDLKIVRAIHKRPEMNSMTHYYHGPHWDLSDPDVAVANYRVEPSPLEAVKVNYRELAASERYRKESVEIGHVIDGLEVTLSTKREDRSMFSDKYMIMGPKETTLWKFKEGWLTLSRDDVKGIIVAIDSHVQKQFDWERSIVDQIDAAEDSETVASIQIFPVDKEVDLEDAPEGEVLRGGPGLRQRALQMKRARMAEARGRTTK